MFAEAHGVTVRKLKFEGHSLRKRTSSNVVFA